MSLSKTDRLRELYNSAFEEWALEVNRLQAEIESAPAGGVELKEAEDRAAAAENAYRESRDLLLEEMLIR